MSLFLDFPLWILSLLIVVPCLSAFIFIYLLKMYGIEFKKPKRRSQTRSPYSTDHESLPVIKENLSKIEKLLGIALIPVASNRELDQVISRLQIIIKKLERREELANISAHTPKIVKYSDKEPISYLSESSSPQIDSDLLRKESTLSVSSLKPVTESFLSLYNRAVHDRLARETFCKQYQFLQLGNKNSIEQHLGYVSEPDLRETTNGDFLAIRKEGQLYEIVPQFDITITPQNYISGGIDFVFECPNYDSNLSYSDVRVRRPALFKRHDDQWIRLELGELIL